LGEVGAPSACPAYEHDSRRTAMACITIKTNSDEGLITLRECLEPSNMQSEFFCADVLERLR
jgi:hypothetical protein